MLKIDSVKRNIFTSLFNSLYRTKRFGQIIAICLLIGAFSLLNFRKNAKENLRTRLENRLDTFTSSINENIKNHATTLSMVDAYFRSKLVLDTKNLSGYLDSIYNGNLSSNIDRIEFIEFDPRISTMPNGGKFEREALMNAVRSGQITISNPVTYYKTHGSTRAQLRSLVMYLPYYGRGAPPTTPEERIKNIKGILFIPIDLNEFFATKYGSSILGSENVNFRVDLIDNQKNKLLIYERLNPKLNYKYLESSSAFDIYGKQLQLTATTLPEFFTLWDRYLPNILFAFFAVMLVLLAGIFFQTRNLLHHEEKANLLKEESNRVKAAFLSNMSHEIRTPLNAINGFSKILSHSTDEAEKQYLVENIKKNSNELTNFIDNILDISRIEFGRIVINRKYLNLVSFIEKIKLPMENRAFSKGLLFEIESLGTLPTEIEVDEARIKQILFNLVGNAVKFTEKGYIKLQIEAQNAGFGQTLLMFTIVDTGIGIATSSQLELFQQFSQIDYSNTRRYGGIGLGLALSRRLAQQLDGEVSLLESQLERGSVFRLRIPCGNLQQVPWKENLFSQLHNSAVQLDFLGNLRLENCKILIVDDSADNQNIFNYFLNSAGADTALAANGKMAVEMASVNDYDLILMDIQMPVLDGLAATKQLREQGFRNPIVALTAHASVEAKFKCLEAGCVDLITKPVTGETLVKKINVTLEEFRNGTKNNYT